MEVAKKEVQKKQAVVERRKAEAEAAKQWRDRRGIGLSNEDDDNYYSDTDNTDPDQENNLNLVQGRNGGRRAGDDMNWTLRCYLKTLYYNTLLGLVFYKCQYYLIKDTLCRLLIYPAQLISRIYENL